ncbi:hypothetical protein E2976_10990 [Paracoccus yeei]
MIRSTMETPAWRALTTTAQALYPWLKMEWKGPQANNNGKISLPVREAAERLGCGRDTAARGFHDLQAKGFLLLTSHGRMVEGKGAPPTYEITELAVPGCDSHSGKKLYLHWRPGHDFPVSGHAPVNPTGRNGRENKTPSSKSGRNVIKIGTKT